MQKALFKHFRLLRAPLPSPPCTHRDSPAAPLPIQPIVRPPTPLGTPVAATLPAAGCLGGVGTVRRRRCGMGWVRVTAWAGCAGRAAEGRCRLWGSISTSGEPLDLCDGRSHLLPSHAPARVTSQEVTVVTCASQEAPRGAQMPSTADTTKKVLIPEPAPAIEAQGREAGKGLFCTQVHRTSPRTARPPTNQNLRLKVQTGPGPSVPDVSPSPCAPPPCAAFSEATTTAQEHQGAL